MKAGLKRRKNFLPTLFLTIIFWGLLVWLVFSYPPENNSLIFTFYVLFFLALFFTSALILANSRRGLFLALVGICFLFFRYQQIANLLNLILLLSIFISLEIYYSQKNRSVDKKG